MTSTMLGELEKQVLLALLRLGGESYAVPVAHELTELTGREVSPAVKGVAITFYGSSLIINEEGGLAGRCRRCGPCSRPEGGAGGGGGGRE